MINSTDGKKTASPWFVLCLLALFGIHSSQAQLLTYLVDFGGGGFNTTQINNGRVATSSPDANGNYWNNSVGGDLGQPSNLSNLVNTSNQSGGISLTWTNWGSGVSSANMGVTSVPSGSGLSSSLLNIGSAINDSVFTQNTTGVTRVIQFNLDGLVVGQNYDFSIFASRSASDTRRTSFTVTGSTVLNQTVQTSGSNLSGTGLNYSTSLWNFSITPDAQGKVAVALQADGSLTLGSQYAYVNAMSIATVPEPSAGALLSAGLAALALRRSRRRR